MFERVKLFVKNIQAMAEGARRSILNPLNWNPTTQQSTVRKNNFQTYEEQLKQVLNMYHGKCDYGSSLTRSGIDIRSAFIAGEGISITGGSKKLTAEWINEFLKDTKLKGSKFQDAVTAVEQEGKGAFIIKKIGNSLEDQKIKIKFVKYSDVKYTIYKNEFDEPEKMTWEEDGVEQSLIAEDFQYINYNEFENDINDSAPPIFNVIQQIINYERALYDLRANNHLYGRTTPLIKGKDQQSTVAVVNLINSTNWEVGKALPINGDVTYLEPGVGALESVRGEMSLNIKLFASVLGVPVHWSGWTDLMSNRATADTLSELVETCTKSIRQKWIECIRELIQKAMRKSERFGGSEKDVTGFDVELPQITAEKIKELIDAWFILAEAGYVAKEILINKLPGIDPEQNRKALEKEKKETEKNKPDIVKEFEDSVNNDNKKQEVNENE